MNTNPYYIIKAPMLTEESTRKAGDLNQYAFRVDPGANKNQIRDAVEKMFSVTVTNVNTMNYSGKRAGRRGRYDSGNRPNWKKAVVTLKDGDRIDII